MISLRFESLVTLASLLGFSVACLDGHAISGSSIRRSSVSPLGKTAIKNVRVFDGQSFTQPKTIIIDHDRISSCAGNVTNTIDALGNFLIPGLIDNHLHLKSMEGLENVTSYGVTTAMNMACDNYTVCATLRNQDGLADFHTASAPAYSSNTSDPGPNPNPVIVYPDSNTTVLANWAFGNHSDYFKVRLAAGAYSTDMLSQLVDSVHMHGRKIMSHAADVQSYLQSTAAGVDSIQHTPDDGMLSETNLLDILKHRQYVTPTLTIFKLALDPPNPYFLQYLRGSSTPGNTSYAMVQQNVAAMHKAGIPILAGADSVGMVNANVSIPFGISLHQELQYLVDAGLTPAEAINAATSVAAQWHDLPDRGVIREGMRADLLLLKSDPLANISNTLDIGRIWVNGREYAGPLRV